MSNTEEIIIDLNNCSEQLRAELIIGVSENKMNLSKIFSAVQKEDEQYFISIFDQWIENLENSGAQGYLTAVSIRKTIKPIIKNLNFLRK